MGSASYVGGLQESMDAQIQRHRDDQINALRQSQQQQQQLGQAEPVRQERQRMAFKKLDLTMDARGKTQSREQRIARITSLFQAGEVTPENARTAIGKLGRGDDVDEIETVRLDVLPVMPNDTSLKEAEEEALAEIKKSQGLSPARKPTLEQEP